MKLKPGGPAAEKIPFICHPSKTKGTAEKRGRARAQSYLSADDFPECGRVPAFARAGHVGDVGVRAEGVRRRLGEGGFRAADLGEEDAAAVLEAAQPAAPHEVRHLGRERPLQVDEELDEGGARAVKNALRRAAALETAPVWNERAAKFPLKQCSREAGNSVCLGL